jgi:hypothetical protein
MTKHIGKSSAEMVGESNAWARWNTKPN